MLLKGANEIDWVVDPLQPGVESKFIYFGKGGAGDAIQIAHAISATKPSRTILKSLFQARRGKLQIKLVVAVTNEQTAYLFGPDPDAEVLELSEANAENVLNAILLEPSGVFAYRRAVSLRKAFQSTEITGFNNNGLFASHYLRTSTETHPKWLEYAEGAKILKNLRHMELINGLGFEVTGDPAKTLILKAKGQDKRVVAVLLDQNESFDSSSPRFQATPVEWGLGMATEQGAPWLIALRDAQIRLYPAKDGVGVGQKSQVETYFEVDLLTLDEEKAALLPLIFSAEALAEDGTVDEFLRNSQKFASELGIRLRERVYESIVPVLSKEIANQLRTKGHQLDSAGLQLSYELTLRILFRMLFQAYAEDRGLLPAGRNERFDKNSMKSWADDFLKSDEVQGGGDSSSLWYDLMQVWDAIDQGSSDMQIPAYNGGLFGIDPELHPAGHLIRSLSIPDRVMKPALKALLIDDHTEDGVAGKVDFRSLSVREFGTIYEGLLESSLSVAEQDLTVDKKGAWVPAKEGDTILASANEVYFHSASGERKATGSYYTPSFVVDHLIERSVEPALKAHLAKVKIKIDAGDQPGAYEDFFDFRVADLAMGSAHFLVAAIDKIEAVMRSFLIQEGNRVDGVEAELMRLENAAKFALGEDEAAYAEIERSSLLRRQIARRCIYGLDINPLAVELSRLAIWIHTFVPGLPMSSLEHGLVCANSLTGIGSVEEGLNALIPGREKVGTSLFDAVVEKSLMKAKALLVDLANADEADKAGAKRAAVIAGDARQAAAKSKLIFDLAVANRNGVISTGAVMTEEGLVDLASNHQVQALIEAIAPAHMPYLFPEVFLRENPGFDSLVGNPPFKEPVAEELEFWALRFKGLNGFSNPQQILAMEGYRLDYPSLYREFEELQLSTAQIRKSLHAGPYPGMGTGDPDFYKAFAWRFYGLCREEGSLGLVMPHSIWTTKGSGIWRKKFFQTTTSDITLVSNANGWVFENVNVGYRFAFIAAIKSSLNPVISVRGTFTSFDSYKAAANIPTVGIEASAIIAADADCALPGIDGAGEIELWAHLISFPALGDGRLGGSRRDVQCAPASEIHVANDGRLGGVFTGSPDDHPVYNHLNVGRFNFDPLIGPFNFADFDSYVATQERLSLRLVNRADSAIRLWGAKRLEEAGHPIRSPRIVFRDVVHASNRRKVWVALAPSGTLLTNAAPYLVMAHGDKVAEAYLLGVLNSGTVDWFATLKIGLHLNFFILYTIPVPLFTGSISQTRIAELAARLATAGGGDFGAWADFGAPIFGDAERLEAIAEIDYLTAVEFDLSEEQLRIVHDRGNPLRSSFIDVSEFSKGESK
jgi:hypothetical protein